MNDFGMEMGHAEIALIVKAYFSVHQCASIGVRGGGGGGWGAADPPPPPGIFQISFSGKKNHTILILGQNHLIFGQAMDKIFGQLTSAPLNETGPVGLCVHRMSINLFIRKYMLYHYNVMLVYIKMYAL